MFFCSANYSAKYIILDRPNHEITYPIKANTNNSCGSKGKSTLKSVLNKAVIVSEKNDREFSERVFIRTAQLLENYQNKHTSNTPVLFPEA